MRMDDWSPAEIAVLREAWADDTIASPREAAMEKLPHRTGASIQVRASTLGFARERMLRVGRSPLVGAPRTKAAPQPHKPPAAPPIATPHHFTVPRAVVPAHRSAPTAPPQRVPDFLRDDFDRWGDR